MATVPIHYEKLIESTGALVERGIVSRETLLRRASCLKQTIDALEFKAFRILPTRYIRADGTGMLSPFFEYQRTTSKRSIEMRIIQCGSLGVSRR